MCGWPRKPRSRRACRTMNNYLLRLSSKRQDALQVAYNQREKYVTQYR